MDTTLARPPIGQLLDGRYRVESLIARGGMATVYLGTDTRLERTVALKIMHAELANDEDFVRRFVGEARSVAQLSHPNVVTVYDQGADGQILYLAMEYVPGRTLRDLLNSCGRLSPREALDIMAGVLGGLAAAHDAGIAHRDVKPENVLLNDSGAVKVADFGLARLLAGVSQTKSGMIIGTAAYLAPEQVAGGAADARTDVYAAGVMLFELLTGRQPHTGDTPLAVAYKHVHEAVPPPSSAVPGFRPHWTRWWRSRPAGIPSCARVTPGSSWAPLPGSGMACRRTAPHPRPPAASPFRRSATSSTRQRVASPSRRAAASPPRRRPASRPRRGAAFRPLRPPPCRDRRTVIPPPRAATRRRGRRSSGRA